MTANRARCRSSEAKFLLYHASLICSLQESQHKASSRSREQPTARQELQKLEDWLEFNRSVDDSQNDASHKDPRGVAQIQAPIDGGTSTEAFAA
jgi:hypothetical protein